MVRTALCSVQRKTLQAQYPGCDPGAGYDFSLLQYYNLSEIINVLACHRATTSATSKRVSAVIHTA